MSTARAQRSRPRAGRGDVESRIIAGFTAHARTAGPSAVVMADLARDLGMSTKTLYKEFPTKADLVHRLVERWAARLERQLDDSSEEATGPFVDQLLSASEVWQANRRRFGPVFWDDLEREYPDAFAIVNDARARLRARMLERLRPFIRPEIPPALAMELFDATLAGAFDTEVQRRAGVDGRAAVRAAVRVWAHGALTEPLPKRPPR